MKDESESKRDDILRRMLNTPPKKHKDFSQKPEKVTKAEKQGKTKGKDDYDGKD